MAKKLLKVLRIPIPTPTLYPHTTTNSYLIGNEDESLLIDAGYNQEQTRESLDEAIRIHRLAVPKRIILTHAHPDHAPGVLRLLDWNPEVYCHKEEEERVLTAIAPIQKVTFLRDKELINVAEEKVTVLHTPGHTPGHLNLYLPRSKILITGDNIVSDGTTWIGAPDGNMTAYFSSLKRIQTLDLAKIGPGHGDWVMTPYEQIEFVLNRRITRETQILSLLKKHSQLTVHELTKLIYENNIHASVVKVATLTIEAHLEKLLTEQLVNSNGAYYFVD